MDDIKTSLRKKYIYIDTTQITRNSMLWGFLELGCDIIRPEIKADIHSCDEEDVNALMTAIKSFDVAITQNFVASVAEACHRLNIKYISWVYDSPQMALFRKEAEYETNYIFMFDKAGMEYVLGHHRLNIYHLPLAANITEASLVNITDEDIQKYGCEVSFVGSLYNKDYLENGYIPTELRKELEQKLSDKVGRYSRLYHYEPILDDEIVRKLCPYIDMSGTKENGITAGFLADQLFAIPIIARNERIMYINRVAERYDTRLYTREENVKEIKAEVFPPVNPEDEMYKAFYSSKINLNITHRGIISGIPQRVFDIMAVGGFVLTNYQSEIEELFEIGKEIEVFTNPKEFDEKLEYYLTHENERVKIGINGYLKAKELYNYRKATKIMLEKVFG